MEGKMEDFSNQVAIITGASRGIGKAISRRFLAQGAKVIGIYAGNREAAEIFLAQAAEAGWHLEMIQCDISDSKQVSRLFQGIEEQQARLDILVNNAGIRRDAVLALMAETQWQQVLDTNLTGTYLMCRLAVPLMMQNKYGRIINITSPAAHIGFPGQANYAASKAGQIALTRTLAKEVARKKITVNCVSPGFIETDFIQDLPADQLSAYKKMVPMRRFGKPEEVADGVLYLASRGASYISGTTLDINGGL